jgi:hypothetical protein
MSPEVSRLLALSASGSDGKAPAHLSGSPAWRRTAARAWMLS